MKRVLMTILAAVLLVSASTAQSLRFQTFTDSVGVMMNGVPIYSTVKVDFPVDGPAKLVTAIKNAMAKRLEVSMADTKDGKTFVNKVANKTVADLKEMFVKDYDQDETIPELYISHYVNKKDETSTYVTMMYGGNVYYGGAHGDYYAAGVTYRKSDGRDFRFDILKDGDVWEQIQDKVAAAMRKSYEVNTNAELREILMSEQIICDGDLFFVPMPENHPFVDNGDLVFLYATYEIAPFAVGMPEVRIPLKDIMQHLSDDVVEMLK